MIQLDLFEENDELTLMRKELYSMKESLDKQRKSQFAKINDLSKELILLKQEIYSLKFYIKGTEILLS